MIAYWPLVLVLTIAALTTIYHVATPRRAPWWRNIPGAVLAFAIWVVASVVVRTSLEASLGGPSIYGPLSTPIVLLIWLYVLAIAILIGAGLNAATRVLWPVHLHDGLGRGLLARARDGAENLFTRTDSSMPESGGEGARVPTSRKWTAGPGEPDEAQVGQGERAREQQFEHRERSALAEAIARELDRGLGSGKD
jgi:membrane protein